MFADTPDFSLISGLHGDFSSLIFCHCALNDITDTHCLYCTEFLISLEGFPLSPAWHIATI